MPPAGIPPRGLDRRFLVADRILRNTGSDTSVNYQAAAFNAATGVIFVAGNNDFVGLMSNGLYGELVQGANLPPTNNAMQAAAHDNSVGGWLVMDGASACFRNPSEDLSSAWSTITPPEATSRDDFLEYNGALLTFTASLSIPDRDIEFSTDQGATWDTNPGDFTGINSSLQRAVTNPLQTRLLVTSGGGDFVAFTIDQGSPPYSWTLLPIETIGIPQVDAAISDSGEQGVVVATNGQIWTTSDFSPGNSGMIPNADNPFVSTNIGTAIVSVVFIADMQGFILITTSGPRCAFIPTSDMTQVIPGNYLGESATINRYGISDGEQAIWVANTSEAMVTLRNIGQSSRF